MKLRVGLSRGGKDYLRCPFFSSCDITDPASRLASVIVGFLSPLRILEAKVGEGIVYDGKGMPDFALLHSHEYDREVSMLAFDLLALNSTEVRRKRLIERKELLEDLLKRMADGIEFSDHIEGDARAIFEHACKLGHEGIVVKRKYLAYESGRSKRWLKIKNPESPAMKLHKDGTF